MPRTNRLLILASLALAYAAPSLASSPAITIYNGFNVGTLCFSNQTAGSGGISTYSSIPPGGSVQVYPDTEVNFYVANTASNCPAPSSVPLSCSYPECLTAINIVYVPANFEPVNISFDRGTGNSTCIPEQSYSSGYEWNLSWAVPQACNPNAPPTKSE